MVEETPSKAPVESTPAESENAQSAEAEQPKAAAKPKKEKPPAVEEKPFGEFIRQYYFPALQTAFKKQGVDSVELNLVNQKIPVKGLSQEPGCWQVVGSWGQGRRQFNLYFLDEDIQGQRAFSCMTSSTHADSLEPFLGDERKITLDLLVFGVMQRLNGQKWLARN
jgi:hypothetical protein